MFVPGSCRLVPSPSLVNHASMPVRYVVLCTHPPARRRWQTPFCGRDSLPAYKYMRVSRFVGSSHRAGVSHLVECWGGADLVMAAVKDADQHQSQVSVRVVFPSPSLCSPDFKVLHLTLPCTFQTCIVSYRMTCTAQAFCCRRCTLHPVVTC